MTRVGDFSMNNVEYVIKHLRLPPDVTLFILPYDLSNYDITITLNFDKNHRLHKDTAGINTILKGVPAYQDRKQIAKRIHFQIQHLKLHEIDEWIMLDKEYINAPHEDGKLLDHTDMMRHVWNLMHTVDTVKVV